MIETVKSLVGNASKFDLRGLKEIPNVDLPNLRLFFENMLMIRRRRIIKEGEAFSFKTPEE